MAYKISKNDVTGDTIQTGKGSQELFSEGWNRVFSKKQKELLDEPLKFTISGGAYLVDEPSAMGAGHFKEGALELLANNLCTTCGGEKGSQGLFSEGWNKVFSKLPPTPLCNICHGEGGCFDCGWWYECPFCILTPPSTNTDRS